MARAGATIVDEASLDAALRREAGALLAAEWGDEWREDGYAGPHAPRFRAVELDDAGRLAAHVSAFLVPARPALVLYGVGDLVVAPAHRRHGAAARVATALVGECARRGADVVLVDTAAARRQFAALGFAAVRPWSFFYERDGACRRHEHWMARWSAAPAGRVELLEHGDF